MDAEMTVRELRPIRIPTLAEARLLSPAHRLPRRLPADAEFDDADWFLGTPPGWESMAVRYRVGGGWLRAHQIEPLAGVLIGAIEAAPRTLATGRIVCTATLANGCSLVKWQDEDGRRFDLTSNVLSVDELAAIAATVP